MSLMHGQTNGHVVTRREVSAEDLSKQLENRHFIHERSDDFSTWANWTRELLFSFGWDVNSPEVTSTM